MKNGKMVGTVVVAAIIFGAAGFFGGMQYRNWQLTQSRGQLGQRAGFVRGGVVNGAGTVRMGGRPVAGQIIAADTNSITVKMPDGSSRIVLINDQTNVTTATKTTKDQLKTGSNVTVFGTENSDGSITAQNVAMVQ